MPRKSKQQIEQLEIKAPEKKEEKPIKAEIKPDRLEEELKKIQMGSENIFEESNDTPDQYKKYPYIVVCDVNPSKFMYPILLSLEHSNIVRLHAISRYASTVLRIQELFSWCMDIRMKRKRFVISDNGKKLIVSEHILEKIPACRG